MKNTTLVRTLQLFSAQELDEIEAFIQSPFFNKGTHFNSVLKLFRLLKEVLCSPSPELPEADELAAALSDGASAVSVRYLNNLSTKLLALVRKYIAWKQMDAKWGPALEDLLNGEFYQERGHIELKEKMLHRAQRSFKKQPPPPQEAPLLRFWLEESIFQLENIRNIRQGDLNLPNTIESLTLFFAVQLMEKALVEMQQQRVYPAYQPAWAQLMADMRRSFRAHQHLGAPSVKLIDEAMLLFEQPSEDPKAQIQRFLELLDRHRRETPEPVVRIVATLARNFCTWKCNDGYAGLNQLRFQLYKQHLQEGWLHLNQKLTPSVFLNLITISTREREFEWLKQFLDQHRDKVESPDAEKLVSYGYAILYLAAGDLGKSRDHFVEMQKHPRFGDAIMNSRAYVLEIKILYKEDSEQLFSRLDNYRMHLSRNKRYYDEKSRERKNRFIKYIRQLADLRQAIQMRRVSHQQCKVRLAELIKQLSSSVPVSERRWLLEEARRL